jgi:hypothetical protein
LEPSEPPADTGPRPGVRGWVVAIIALSAAVTGGIVGYAVRDESVRVERVAAPGSDDDGRDVNLDLDASISTYLDALVSHDWRRANALMCADLAEDVLPGTLKRELAGSEESAGPLSGFRIVERDIIDERSATVAYVLEFERGEINIDANFEREGDQWRVCSFTTGSGTGPFAAT